MSAEYNEPDSEDEKMGGESQPPSRERDASFNIPTAPKDTGANPEPTESVDPALADWLNVDARDAATEESETEPESDVDSINDDVGKDIDEWIEAPSGSETLESFQVLVSLLFPLPSECFTGLERVVSIRRKGANAGECYCLISKFVVDDE